MALTIDALKGRVLDTDSHEMSPSPRWQELFGERGAAFAKAADELIQMTDAAASSQPTQAAKDGRLFISANYDDTQPVTQDTVWGERGFDSPGAIDLSRRHEVLDEMGIARALVFPGMGILAWEEAHGGGFSVFPIAPPERQKIAHEALEAFNDWAISHATDRLRIAGMLSTGKPGMTPELMCKQAEAMIKSGLRVVHIGTGHPPGGVGPADPALDKFYALLCEANVALVTHPPAGMGIMSDAWNRAASGLSFAANHHMGEENLVGQLTLGGVFERHPTLRLGCIESGSDWIGPLASRLDVGFEAGRAPPLKLRPSEYINRQVRVSALAHEPVEKYLTMYPEVQDSYTYSSDYPHTEGQTWSIKKFYQRVAPLGDKVVEKFFYKNAELLLPA